MFKPQTIASFSVKAYINARSLPNQQHNKHYATSSKKLKTKRILRLISVDNSLK